MATPGGAAGHLLGRKVAERTPAGELVVDAGAVAPLLGLSPAAFMDFLRQGIVYQTHELGTGADAGKERVTFRYRSRRAVLVLDRTGRVVEVG